MLMKFPEVGIVGWETKEWIIFKQNQPRNIRQCNLPDQSRSRNMDLGMFKLQAKFRDQNLYVCKKIKSGTKMLL